MNRSRRPRLVLVALAVTASTLLAVASPRGAYAEPLSCKRALSSESAKYTRLVTTALQRCEDAKVAGTLPPATDCATASHVLTLTGRAQARLMRKVGARCGGDDRICGTADDDSLVTIGWGAIGTCPGLKGASCSNTISNCGDIATCLACVGQAAAGQTVALDYGSFNSGEFGTDSPVNLCQRSIGKGSTKFFIDRLRALQKCWDGRLRGNHSNACPDPGDGKAVTRIAHAEESKIARICRPCGGADHQCGGGDDVQTSQVGFASQCSDVTPPTDGSCSGAIADMSGVVTCVDCDATFQSDCVGALGVSALVPYPEECGPTPPPDFCPAPPVPAMIGQIAFTGSPGTANCGGASFSPPANPPFSGEVDDGNGTKLFDLGLGCLYSGSASMPGVALPDGFTSLLAITGTSGSTLTLGGSDGTGPADCTKGAGPAMHCLNTNPGASCTADADCGAIPNNCALDANCFFGPPTPVPNGGLSICIMNALRTDICGVADLTAMSTTLAVALSSRIYLTTNSTSPCPRCESGSCTAGDRAGMSCTGGVGTKGTTLECPPSSYQFLGTLPVSLVPATTGTSLLPAPNGAFCPAQTTAGAFGLPGARLIREVGQPLTPAGLGTFTTALAATVCIPASGSLLVDGAVGLPGPGALSISGTTTVNIP